jgi:plasmid stabilization system protein ParE
MVKHAVHWSKQSKADLKNVFEYIKNAESQERAIYVITGIKEIANEIVYFPAKHAKEPFILDKTVRYAIKWRYKILFTIDEKRVNIVRVFHTSQNPEKINFYSG